ncbi:hypothetical protein [Streptomyces sp. NPDC002328]|uniref:hypothetical protein n=1 Tax=Streptomyces sp. NPDC002328 TaxID=3364642 RepID=UPI0036A2B5C8
MSDSTPPPQPVEGNPYAQQPAGGNPYAQQPGPVPPGPVPPGAVPPGPVPAAFAPPAPPAPARGNVALGLLTALVVALVTAGIYGAIVGATEYEIGYAAVGVGFLVGFAAGKVGGANPALPVVSAVLSLGAVYLGQIIGIGVLLADLGGVSVTEVFTEHLDVVTKGWSEEADAMTYLFLGIGAFAAFSGAKKAAA